MLIEIQHFIPRQGRCLLERGGERERESNIKFFIYDGSRRPNKGLL